VIFEPAVVDMIRQGKKRMTRRPVAPREEICRYKPGHTYKLQAGGQGQVATWGTITIVAVRKEKLGDITRSDARKEGFKTTLDVQRHYAQLAGGWRPEMDVWVIEFALGDTRDQPRLLRLASPKAPICTARVKRNGQSRPCGRAFADNQDVCKCGAKRPAETPEDRGYTSRGAMGMRNEGEAVPEHLQDRWSEDAEKENAAKRELDKQRLRAVTRKIREQSELIRTNGAITPQQRKRLKSAEHHLRLVEEEAA
jgi:hypothetical protein